MGGDRSAPGRIGVYQDGPFRLVESEDGLRMAPDPADAPFFRFVTQVAEPLTSCGRSDLTRSSSYSSCSPGSGVGESYSA
jgi:hypothetical protein